MPFENNYNGRLWLEHEASERRLREEAQAREDAAELSDIMRACQRKGIGHDVDLNLQLAAYWARVYRARLVWLRDGTVPYCIRVTREIGAAFPADPPKVAVLAHEISHLLIPACPGPPHHAQFVENHVASCLECETAATVHASSRLLPMMPAVHFTPLTVGLRSYRTTAPAPPSVLARADAVLSGLVYRQARQRHLEFELRIERQRVAERECK